MKVENRCPGLRLDQSQVNLLERELPKVFPGSHYITKLKKFPRALAAEVVEYRTVLEKLVMKRAADDHDATMARIYNRVKIISEAAQASQELVWEELFLTLKFERQENDFTA